MEQEFRIEITATWSHSVWATTEDEAAAQGTTLMEDLALSPVWPSTEMSGPDFDIDVYAVENGPVLT